MKTTSEGEELMHLHLELHKIDHEREFRFIEGRKYRADFLIAGTRLLVEIEGGLWISGRHNRPSSIEADYIKGNLAILAGWNVLHFSTAQVKSGHAIAFLLKVLHG